MLDSIKSVKFVSSNSGVSGTQPTLGITLTQKLIFTDLAAWGLDREREIFNAVGQRAVRMLRTDAVRILLSGSRKF